MIPCFEPVLITRPGRPRSSIPGTKACVPWMTPHRFTSRRRSQLPSGPSAVVGIPVPALFMSTSVPPKRSRTTLSRRTRSATRLTSISRAMTSSELPPVLRAARATPAISWRAFSRRSAPRSAMATRMPSEANFFAAARPMPEAPPVMTATAPAVRAGCELGIPAIYFISCSSASHSAMSASILPPSAFSSASSAAISFGGVFS